MIRRRDLLKTGGIAVAAAAMPGISGAKPQKPHRLHMAVLPPPLDKTTCTHPDHFTETVHALSGQRLVISHQHISANGLPADPADLFSNPKIDMVLGSLTRHPSPPPAYHFFSGIPFGMTANETLSWIKQGDGQQHIDRIFSKRGISAHVAGITGVKPAGWYKFDIDRIEDFKGRRIGINGLGAEVMAGFGAIPVQIQDPVETAKLSGGQLDGIAGTCPATDMSLGLPWSGATLYWPGWHTSCSITMLLVRKKSLRKLPADLQEILSWSTYSVTNHTAATYAFTNILALKNIMETPDIRIRQVPDQVTAAIAYACHEKIEALSAASPDAEKIAAAYFQFFRQVVGWTQISDEAFSLARSLSQAYL